MSKASKIQKLLDYLRRHGRATREELALYLNVNKKTITTYINDINADHHVYIHSETGKYGGYTLKEINPKIVMDKSEINALSVSEGVIKKLRPEIYPEFKSLSEKLRQLYQKQTELEAASKESFITASTSLHTSKDRKLEEKLNQVINEHQIIELYYEDVNKTKLYRIVDPYEIVSYKGSVYLIAFCHLRKELRTFKLNRIKDFKRTSNFYQTVVSYNVESIYENNIGIYIGKLQQTKLRITSPFDVIVSEKQWFKTQKITRETESSILLDAVISDDEETISWLLSMKDCVEIISPDTLKNRYLETVKKIYSKNFN